MSEISKQPIDLEELLFRVLSNEATPAEVSWLNQSLKESETLRAEACQFLCDDSLVTELFESTSKADAFGGRFLAGGDPLHRATGQKSPKSPSFSVLEQINRQGLAVASIAAMLVLGLFAYNYTVSKKLERLHNLSVLGTEQQPKPTEGTYSTDSIPSDSVVEAIGRVSGLNAPVWSPGAPPLSFGDKVTRGQLIEIESGIIELLLTTGAKVTIEGPASFEASSALESFLSRGKLAAAAPRLARGYTVLTPTAELVDIGTQFGVVVEESGDSELHVFDGDVVARSRLAAGNAELIHAKQDEAMRFNSLDAKPERINAREQEFIRHITPAYEPDQLPPLPTSDSLLSWYAADMCTDIPEGSRVGVWRDLLIGDNDFADNAWQFDDLRRPRMIKDGAGRPALLFDGWSNHLATSPMDPAKQQTIFIVFMPAPITYGNVQVLYKFGQAPSLELTLLSNASVRGWVWPGPGMPSVGEVQSTSIDNIRPSVIAYQYDTINDSSQMWVNGKLQGASEAPVEVLLTGQNYIGCHPGHSPGTEFFGNLYEVIVFNRVFDDEELEVFWEYFLKRYDMEQR